jgi:hypothetical protein
MAQVSVSNNSPDKFCKTWNIILCHMSKWFTANRPALNLDRTSIIQFITNNSLLQAPSIGCYGKYIQEPLNMKFLGLQIHNNLNCTNYIDKVIGKLSGC